MRAGRGGDARAARHLDYSMSNKTTEIFLPVPGYDAYECSTHGRVRRIGSVECLTPSPAAGKRYLAVCLSKDGKSKNVYVHRVIASSHIGEIPRGYCVHHRDTSTFNNHVSNLEIVTRQQNAAYSHADGTAGTLRGETCPERQGIRGRFNPTQVRCLRRAHDSGVRGAVAKMATELGCSSALAGAVARGTLYAWVLDTAIATEIARAEAIASRNLRRVIAASKRARTARIANTHRTTPPATIVGGK